MRLRLGHRVHQYVHALPPFVRQGEAGRYGAQDAAAATPVGRGAGSGASSPATAARIRPSVARATKPGAVRTSTPTSPAVPSITLCN